MKHKSIICESTDAYLASWKPPQGPVVDLTSDNFPKGWPVSAGKKYKIVYDDETGDVDMDEVSDD